MDSNFDALDAYNKAWVSGDSAEIYPLLADSYTLRLGAEGELVSQGCRVTLSTPAWLQITKPVFFAEWKKFRKMVEEAGGPKVSQNGNFIKTTNAVLKEVKRFIRLKDKVWCSARRLRGCGGSRLEHWELRHRGLHVRCQGRQDSLGGGVSVRKSPEI